MQEDTVRAPDGLSDGRCSVSVGNIKRREQQVQGWREREREVLPLSSLGRCPGGQLRGLKLPTPAHSASVTQRAGDTEHRSHPRTHPGALGTHLVVGKCPPGCRPVPILSGSLAQR